jgi:hypothetical protein
VSDRNSIKTQSAYSHNYRELCDLPDGIYIKESFLSCKGREIAALLLNPTVAAFLPQLVKVSHLGTSV